MESMHQGLKQALEPKWRGGVCCSVINGGIISVGDKVQIKTLP